MKRHFILLFLVLFIDKNIRAQEFTIRIAGGYAWPGLTNSENIMGPKIDAYHPQIDALTPMADLFVNDSMSSIRPVHGSYGQGLNLSLGVGYKFNPYIGVELGVTYLNSATVSCQQTHEIEVDNYPFPSYSNTGYYLHANISTSTSGLSLMPSVIINGVKPGWKIYPYARLGITIPVLGTITHNIDIRPDDSLFTNVPVIAQKIDTAPYFLGHDTKVTLKTQGQFSLGINAAVGVCYRPLPYLSIFAEINGQYMAVQAKSSQITQWDVDGVSKISQRGVYRTQFNFVDQLDKNSNNSDYNKNYDPNKPKDDLRVTGPLSNLGFNVGVTFYLSKEIIGKNKPKQKKKGK